jgi:hypothetical protein
MSKFEQFFLYGRKLKTKNSSVFKERVLLIYVCDVISIYRCNNARSIKYCYLRFTQVTTEIKVFLDVAPYIYADK